MAPSSNKSFIGFDANASEPMRPHAMQAMLDSASLPGNPASPHRDGRAARALLEAARRQIAGLFGAEPENLVFTSGGTEANALAVHETGRPILFGASEHDSIRNAVPPASAPIPIAPDGRVRLDALERLLSQSAEPTLVCLMAANNETGVIHPLADVASLCRRHRAWLHVDAVQAAGRIEIDLGAIGADSLALSAHKLGGPKGSGALLLGGARRGRLAPLIAGGGQEQGRRGGTPALPAIAGFAAAAAAALADREQRSATHSALRDRIEREAVALGALVCGAASPRLANTSCLALPGRRAEAQLIALDMAGYGVSAGSACSSGKVARSHVLEAMGLGAPGLGATGLGATGLGQLAAEAIRISLPWNTDASEVDGFIDAYRMMVQRRRAAA